MSAAAQGGLVGRNAPSRRAFFGGAVVGALSLCGGTREARAAEGEVAAAPGVVVVSGDGWTLSAPSDFAAVDVPPFLPPPGTTVGAGA